MTHPDRYPPLTPPEHKGVNVVAVFVILTVLDLVIAGLLIWLLLVLT